MDILGIDSDTVTVEPVHMNQGEVAVDSIPEFNKLDLYSRACAIGTFARVFATMDEAAPGLAVGEAHFTSVRHEIESGDISLQEKVIGIISTKQETCMEYRVGLYDRTEVDEFLDSQA